MSFKSWWALLPTALPLRLPLLVRALLALCIAALLFASAQSHAKRPRATATDPVLAGELLVQLRSTADLGPLLQRHRLSLVGQFGARPIYRLRVVGTAALTDTQTALELDPAVLNAEENVDHQSPEARRSAVWAIGTQGAYTAQWAPQALKLATAQRLSTGQGVRVAVLDTGVDFQHAALAGRLLPGFDFVDFDNDPSEVGNALTAASFGHGTHVAALVALAAPGAQIMPLRVLDSQGHGNAWVLAEAMLHAIDPDRNPGTNDGAQVINLSLGSLQRTRLLDTIAALATCSIPPAVLTPIDELADPGYNADRERCNAFGGAIVVAAAGNDASRDLRQYPAAEGTYGLLAVAASTAQSQLAAFSNAGRWVHLAAPGEGITSAIPGNLYGSWSGTSMAAPLVAGSAALLRAARPELSAREAADWLVKSSSGLCGTRLRQVDPLAALTGNVAAAAPLCP